MKSLLCSLLALASTLHAENPGPFFRNLNGTPAEAGNVIEQDGRIRKITTPVMRIFISTEAERKGRVLLFPGGGYSILSAIKEGETTALLLNSAGYDVAVLEYHVSAGPETRKLALQDSLAAWEIFRTNPETLGLHQNGRTGIMGYSAGGHLATRTVMDLSPEKQPDDLILIYPAYLQETGQDQVPLVTAPARTKSRAFILIAKNDRAEWVQSSETFSQTWQAAGGKTTFHLLPDGGHGFGTKEPMGSLLKGFLAEDG